jgi:hypothetical protein
MTDLLEDGPEVVEVDASGNVVELDTKRKGRGQLSDDDIDDQNEPLWSDELLERAREVVSDKIIREGGDYRQLEKGKVYWLPLDLLVEFEEKDLDTEDDDEFFDWFADFVADNDFLTKKEHKKQKEGKRWDGWKSNFNWGAQQHRIGNWWSNYGYESGASGSELTRRLLVAVKAISTTVSVVNDTGHRYRVKLAADTEDQPMSYTSYGEQLIVVSPQALLDTAITQDHGIEVTTGYALHEASHVKYSESLIGALRIPTVLRPESIAHLLHNLLEDIRIEHLTAQKFPGFASYLDDQRAYMWAATAHLIPKEWGPSLQEKTNAVIAMVKWPDEYKATVDADPGLTGEWAWWRQWAEAYVANKEPIRQGVIRGLERLAEDDQTKQEMDELSQAEKDCQQGSGNPQPATDEQFKEMLDKFKELLDAGGQVIDSCPSPGNQPAGPKFELTKEQAQELDRLLEEQYQQFEAFYQMKDGPSDVGPIIEVSKPIETELSRLHYNRPGPMVERLREVFFFRKTETADQERLLKSGSIDEEELWRAGTGDTRVFERETVIDETFTSVTMLVDCSGSMNGRGLNKAQELANVMMACLRTQRGVRTRVRGHSTGAIDGEGQTCRVYRIWEPGDPDTRIGLLNTVYHGSNFDGFAIDWCAKELVDTSEDDEQKLLIVLSDGLPAGNVQRGGLSVHYGGVPAMKHMLDLGDHWNRQGVKIVQIAIDHDGIRPEQQAQMFRHWIGYETDQKLLTDLTRLLIKTFGGID